MTISLFYPIYLHFNPVTWLFPFNFFVTFSSWLFQKMIWWSFDPPPAAKSPIFQGHHWRAFTAVFSNRKWERKYCLFLTSQILMTPLLSLDAITLDCYWREIPQTSCLCAKTFRTAEFWTLKSLWIICWSLEPLKNPQDSVLSIHPTREVWFLILLILPSF